MEGVIGEIIITYATFMLKYLGGCLHTHFLHIAPYPINILLSVILIFQSELANMILNNPIE